MKLDVDLRIATPRKNGSSVGLTHSRITLPALAMRLAMGLGLPRSVVNDNVLDLDSAPRESLATI